MSVRTALYAALTGDSDLTARLATPVSVFHQVAPLSTPFPYVIFAKQHGRPTRAFRGGRVDGELWMVKAVCEGPSATPSENIATEIDRVLDSAHLTIDGRSQLYLARDTDIDYPEQGEGTDLYHHVGGIYRIVTEPS